MSKPHPSAITVLVTALTLAGCQSGGPNGWRPAASVDDTVQAASLGEDTLARGVTHYAIPTGADTGLDIVDVDLQRAAARLAVGAKDIREDNGSVVASALTPTQWVKGGALAAVNGGYFGEDHGASKEIVGLLVLNGRVRHAAPALTGTGGAGLAPGHYARSAFGLTARGIPQITWAATDPGRPQNLRSYATSTPDTLGSGIPWNPRAAIGCGPTLIHNGRPIVSDRSERLVSEGDLPRTFVAYDRVQGQTRHVAIGIASAATFEELTTQIQKFFAKHDHTHAWAAMCLDGGSSTQMTYRVGSTLQTPRATEVGVTDCLLVIEKRK